MPASKFTRADCRGGKACIKEDMKHAMKIVKTEKIKNIFPKRCSATYCSSKPSSKNLYSNGIAGANAFQSDSNSLMLLSRSARGTRTTMQEFGIS